MSRRSGLGRGLSSLIPAAPPADDPIGVTTGPVLAELDVSTIAPNPSQPRVHFDEESLGELAASIGHLGVLQPILVFRVDDGSYQLIAGERRWRAAQRAGLATIPAVVRSTPEDITLVEEALVENLHRQDLTPLEEAAAYLQLIDDFGLTHDEVAQRVGKNRSTISNTLRLLGLPAEVQRMLADGELTAGHAKALLGAADRELQTELAGRIVADGWSVRATEQAVQASRSGDDRTAELPRPNPFAGADHHAAAVGDADGDRGGGGAGGDSRDGERGADRGADVVVLGRDRPAGLLEVEQLLEDHLSTRVRAELGRRGKLTIEFADLDDLTRIYQIMVGHTSSGVEETGQDSGQSDAYGLEGGAHHGLRVVSDVNGDDDHGDQSPGD